MSTAMITFERWAQLMDEAEEKDRLEMEAARSLVPCAPCECGVPLDQDGPGQPFAPRKPKPDQVAVEEASRAHIRQRDAALVRALRFR